MQKITRKLFFVLIPILSLTFALTQSVSAEVISLPIPAASDNSCGSLELGPLLPGVALNDLVAYTETNPSAGWLMNNLPPSTPVYSCMSFNLSECPGAKLNSITLSGRYSLGDENEGVAFNGENGIIFGFLVDGQTLSLGYSGEYLFTNMEPLVGNDGLIPIATSPDIFEKTFYIDRAVSSFSVAMLNVEPSDVAPSLLDNLGVVIDYEDSGCSVLTPNVPSAPKTGLSNSSIIAVAAGFLILPLAALIPRRVRH